MKKGESHKYQNRGWIISELEYESDDNQILSRYPKINPHKVLPEYEYSLWIDGNIMLSHEFIFEILHNKINTNVLYSGVAHWGRDCIYEEAKAIAYAGKETTGRILNTVKFLVKNGHPRNYGLYENNVIFRKHNHPQIIHLDSDWWEMFLNLSHRDQMTLVYCLRKHQVPFDLLLPSKSNARNHFAFIIYKHHLPRQSNSWMITLYKKICKDLNRLIISIFEWIMFQIYQIY